jgi:RecB family exonuclease
MRRRAFDPEALPPDKESAYGFGSSVHEALAGKPGPFSAEVTAMAETFGRSDLARRAAKSPRVEREWEFVKDIDGMLVRGSIDIWFEESGEAVLVDYKTDDVTAAEAKERARHYNSQLALYALALDRKARAGYLHFLRPDVVVEVPVNTAALNEARDLVRKLREAQNAAASTMGFE